MSWNKSILIVIVSKKKKTENGDYLWQGSDVCFLLVQVVSKNTGQSCHRAALLGTIRIRRPPLHPLLTTMSHRRWK